jgi:hypothetical protein
MVLTSNAFLIGMAGVLAAATAKLGVLAMFNLYFVPYWVFVAWLDMVTYLQHHGSSDPTEKLPWYRWEAAPLAARRGGRGPAGARGPAHAVGDGEHGRPATRGAAWRAPRLAQVAAGPAPPPRP